MGICCSSSFFLIFRELRQAFSALKLFVQKKKKNSDRFLVSTENEDFGHCCKKILPPRSGLKLELIGFVAELTDLITIL